MKNKKIIWPNNDTVLELCAEQKKKFYINKILITTKKKTERKQAKHFTSVSGSVVQGVKNLE